MTYRRFGNLVQPGKALTNPPDLRGRVALVTGGTDGVGRSVVDQLAAAGAVTVLTARDELKGQRVRAEVASRTGNDEVHVVPLDLSDLASVRTGASMVLERWDQLDLLICNAGVMTSRDRPLTRDGFELCIGVNHLAHALLVRLLLERLRASAPNRVLIVASEAHRRGGSLDVDDLNLHHGFSRQRAYARSKLANVLYARELARRLASSGVDVRSAHPGGVDTPMMRSQITASRLYRTLQATLLITPEDAAAGLLRVALDPALDGTSGDYYELGKLRRGSRRSRDPELAARLWERTEQLVGP